MTRSGKALTSAVVAGTLGLLHHMLLARIERQGSDVASSDPDFFNSQSGEMRPVKYFMQIRLYSRRYCHFRSNFISRAFRHNEAVTLFGIEADHFPWLFN